jgi:hypothetical protein
VKRLAEKVNDIEGRNRIFGKMLMIDCPIDLLEEHNIRESEALLKMDEELIAQVHLEAADAW